MNQRARSAIKWLGIAVGIAVVLTATFTAGRSLSSNASQGVSMEYAEEASRSSKTAPDAMGGASIGSDGASGAAAQDAAAPTAAAPEVAATEKLVIKNAGVALRVDDVEKTIVKVRSLATKYDAEITDLFVDTPSEDPRPLGEAQIGPSNAQVTVRVPAGDLGRLVADVSGLGAVISENSSANDVTEQYVDLEARLKNLRAEEVRLRQFFDQAKDVDDLLAVQSELARVRGEIEAMTAQITYLERQVARATLTISLSEQGPIVSPGGADWGFRQAITDGLRGAVSLMTTAITAIIAISPLLLAAGLVWFVIRRVSARRAKNRADGELSDPVEAP